MQVPKEVLQDFNRRVFLKAASTGAATAAAATGLGSKAFGTPNGSLGVKEQFLLDRITFGRNAEMVQEIQTRGYTGFLNWQLQLPGEDEIDDSRLFESPKPDETPPFPGGPAYLENPIAVRPWELTPYEIAFDEFDPAPLPPGTTLTYPAPGGGPMSGHGPQLLTRGGWFGKHQLRWVMTDFLQNVHNTYILQPYQYLFWSKTLKEVTYEHALGSYAKLVFESSKSSSMAWYLGQPDSDADAPNENYGRELAELHTMGVDDVLIDPTTFVTFQEGDISEIAKILTGWDMVGWDDLLNFQLPPSNLGDFTFDNSIHATGDKTVSNTGPSPNFGPKTYPIDGNPASAGMAEGMQLIADLCLHPLTALFISKRLVQWFIGDDYQGLFYEVWLRTAVRFYSSHGNLQATVQELFNETFFDQICPPGRRYNKVRRPANKVLNLIRALEAHIDYDAEADKGWYFQQILMGQINGYWAAPNGYQPENDKWIGTMQPVIKFYFDTIWGGEGIVDPGTQQVVKGNRLRVDDSVLDDIFPAGTHITDYARLASERLMGGCVQQGEIDAITTSLINTTQGSNPTHPGDPRRWALFFVLVSPSYQYFC